jgi:type I restriction enzyme, S subunit
MKQRDSMSGYSPCKWPEHWADTTLGAIYEFAYGKGLTTKNRNSNGRYPVYGSNGIVGYHDDFSVEGPVIIVGRKGAAGAVSLSTENCWPIDTTYYVRNSKFIDIKFAFYHLTSLGLTARLEITLPNLRALRGVA